MWFFEFPWVADDYVAGFFFAAALLAADWAVDCGVAVPGLAPLFVFMVPLGMVAVVWPGQLPVR